MQLSRVSAKILSRIPKFILTLSGPPPPSSNRHLDSATLRVGIAVHSEGILNGCRRIAPDHLCTCESLASQCTNQNVVLPDTVRSVLLIIFHLSFRPWFALHVAVSYLFPVLLLFCRTLFSWKVVLDYMPASV